MIAVQRQMDITGGRRGPENLRSDEVGPWARSQLEVASQIIDNPGGGLLFASQTIGQVKAALQEFDEARWHAVIETLDEAEDCGVKRRFDEARRLVAEAAARIE